MTYVLIKCSMYYMEPTYKGYPREAAISFLYQIMPLNADNKSI